MPTEGQEASRPIAGALSVLHNLGLSFERAPARAAARSARCSACACAHAALAGRGGHHARPQAARGAVEPSLRSRSAESGSRCPSAAHDRCWRGDPARHRHRRRAYHPPSLRCGQATKAAKRGCGLLDIKAWLAARPVCSRQSGRAPRRGRIAASPAAPARCVGLVGLEWLAPHHSRGARGSSPRPSTRRCARCDVRCPRRPPSSGRWPAAQL